MREIMQETQSQLMFHSLLMLLPEEGAAVAVAQPVLQSGPAILGAHATAMALRQELALTATPVEQTAAGLASLEIVFMALQRHQRQQ